MQGKQSKQTRILLIGLGVAALLAVVLLWTTLARRSTRATSETPAPTAASDALDNLPDGVLPASAEARRDKREAAASALVTANTPASTEPAAEMIEILVIDRANDKPVANAELVYWAYTEAEERNLKYWEWLSSGEFEARMQNGSETATSDADGKARVKKPKRGAVVAARAGELWGYGVLRYDSDAPWRLELMRDATLSALVVDARGAPVGGARVVLRMRSGEWFWDTATAESRESDGLAILNHAGFMMRQNNGGQAAASIALGGVFEKPVEVAVEMEKLPKDPVRLVVPSTGECEVLIVGPDGQACLDEYHVELRQLTPEETGDSPRPDRSAYRIAGVRGSALFRHVAPGLELLASVGRPGTNTSHSARGPGPTSVGRRATITVRLGETLAIVRGRALDAHGSPLKKAKFHAWVEGGKEDATGADHNWEVESDDEGRFRAEIRPRTIDDGACSIVLIEPDEHGVEQRFASRPLPANLPAGVHEMGDFALAPTPTIATGRVLDGNNTPVRNASVEVSIKHGSDDDEEDIWWQPLWTARAVSDADGRFVLRGRAQADTLAITAQKDGSKATAVLVAPGATDVVLHMGATGEIAGRVLLDPSLSKTGVQLFAERTDAALPTDIDSNQWAPAQLGDDGSFVLRSLRAGVYTVKLRLSGSWTEVQSVEDVRVDSGATVRDPRLNPLDLRTSLVAITLTIVDPDGQPVPHGSIQVTRPEKNDESRVRYAQFENGKGTVTHDGHDVDLVITSTGFRAARIERVHDDRVVTLLRAPRVRLVLAGGQRPPEKPYRLGVVFRPVDDSGVNDWSEEEHHFDARGQLSTFAPAVGRMRVGFSVTSKINEFGWNWSGFDSENDTIIDVSDIGTEQVFEVVCDAKKVAAAIEELRKEGR